MGGGKEKRKRDGGRKKNLKGKTEKEEKYKHCKKRQVGKKKEKK